MSTYLHRSGNLVTVTYPRLRTHLRNLYIGVGFAFFMSILLLAQFGKARGVESLADLLALISVLGVEFWLIIFLMFAAFTALGYWSSPDTIIDLSTRQVRQRGRDVFSIDEVEHVVVQRNPVSLRTHDVMLLCKDGRSLQVYQGLEADARAVAEALHRETAMALAPAGTISMGWGTDSRAGKAVNWAGAILFLGAAAFFVIVGIVESGHPFVYLPYTLSFLVLGLLSLRLIMVLSLPTAERPRYLFDTRTLLVFGAAALAYAIYGFVAMWRDLAELLRDPSVGTLLGMIDGLLPVAGLFAAFWLFRLAMKRRDVA